MLSFAEKGCALPKMHLSISFSLEQDVHHRDLIADCVSVGLLWQVLK